MHVRNAKREAVEVTIRDRVPTSAHRDIKMPTGPAAAPPPPVLCPRLPARRLRAAALEGVSSLPAALLGLVSG